MESIENTNGVKNTFFKKEMHESWLAAMGAALQRAIELRLFSAGENRTKHIGTRQYCNRKKTAEEICG